MRQLSFVFGVGIQFCRRCGRLLSAEDSIDRGIGPVCASKHGAEGKGEVIRSNYDVVEDVAGEPLVIRDLCDGKSVTNDAERVVAELFEQGELPDGRRLFYYDTEGALDELVHDSGRFIRFAPGPKRKAQ